MKKVTSGLIAIAVATTGFFSFKAIEGSKISGTVAPAENAVSVSAISATDTLKAEVTNGTFEFVAPNAGTYTITVEAKAPYKNTVKEGVVVSAETPVNLGEIELTKE